MVTYINPKAHSLTRVIFKFRTLKCNFELVEFLPDLLQSTALIHSADIYWVSVVPAPRLVSSDWETVRHNFCVKVLNSLELKHRLYKST